MKSNKILIDIGHPAQVHQFKYIYSELTKKGYEVLFTAKNKEVTFDLLKAYNIPYKILGGSRRKLISRILNTPIILFQFLIVVLSFKPEIILSRFSIQASWVAYVLSIQHIAFTDTEHVGLSDKLTVPLVKTKITSKSYKKDLGMNHIRYNGNIELFYLHPNLYKPNNDIYKILGLEKKEKYAIVRFVSWDAHHDMGLSGLSFQNKIKLIKGLELRMKVFISSETVLPEEIEDYRISIPAQHMHDAIKFCSLLVGESATMASEAAVLGVPAIYIDQVGRGYTDEEGDKGLVYNFKSSEQDMAVNKAFEVADCAIIDNYYYSKLHADFISDKINPTAFIVWFVINYPQSKRIVLENPDYQLKFI